MKLSLKLLAALVSASFCLQASAATITVININDSGAGSLRQAISDSSPGDTIDFDSSLNGQTITLTTGELLIDKNLTITGPGANLLIINGNAANGVFDITSDVTISGLTITNGTGVDFGGGLYVGGGIFNDFGTLTISNCTLSGNSAPLGGGILNYFGTLTITNSTLSGNSAGAYGGGGIYNFSNGTSTISNCTLSGNSAGGGNNGGGIYNGPGALTISSSTLSGNSADNDGGGIYNPGGPLTITNSTLSGNSAGDVGGGIWDENDLLTITNSTLSGNSASGLGGGGIFYGDGTLTITNSTLSGNYSSNYGGGIFAGSTVTITNSTLSGNSASNYGGGIYNYGALTIANSTLSGNSATLGGGGIDNDHSGGVVPTLQIGNTILKTGASGENIFNYSVTTVISLGYNLSNDVAGGDGTTGPGGLLNAAGDQRNTDPLLGPLQDNGGPTLTHALSVGSAAIDAGDPNFDPNSFTPPLTTDQRGSGFVRVANGRIDIGAFEEQPLPPNTPASDPPGSPVPVDIGTVGSATDITLTYPQVTVGGMTSVAPIDPSLAGTLPSAYELTGDDPPLAFEITTTATYTTPIIIAFQVSVNPLIFLQLRVLHNEGGTLVDRTATDPAPDPTTQTIYASVSSLSPFVVAKLTLSAQVQQPINADRTSVFNVRRGVVPVKFTLTLGGVATCALPAATIAVTRTSGGTTGAVDESVYSGSADTGSNFRISSCQYVYNLSASALGVGTYRADIKINGQVVGSGTFQLK